MNQFSPPSTWYTPPNIYEVDVIGLPDNGKICDQCEVNHVVAKVAQEYSWGWGTFKETCAPCLYKEYEIEVEASKFDQGNE